MAVRPSRTMSLARRAFPKRWRATNSEEFLAPAVRLKADGLAPFTLLVFVDTLVAGFGVRIRTGPPLRHRLMYRFMQRPVPPAWHDWMHDDLASRFIGPRIMLYALAPLWGSLLWMSVIFDGLSTPWVNGIAIVAASIVSAP